MHAIPVSAPWRTRLLAHPVMRIVLGILFVLVPLAATMTISGMLVPKEWRVGWPFLLPAAIVFASYRFLGSRVDQREASEIALTGAGRELLRGLGLGAALGLAVVGLLAAAGGVAIDGTGHWSALLKPLPEQVMVALMEELL